MIRLFKFLKPYRVQIGFVLALVFLQCLAELYLPTLMKDIVNIGIVQGDVPYIVKLGSFMMVVTLAGTLFTIVASYYSSRVAVGFGRMVRGKVFTHVENFSLQEFDKIGTASLITRTTNDITQVQQVLIMIMRMMVMAPMMCIGGMIMAIYVDAKLSLVFVAVIPLLGLLIWLIASKGIPLFKAMQIKLDKLNLVLRESLTGVRVLRSFNRIAHEKARFEEANLDLTDTAIRVNKIMAFMMPVMMLVLNLSSLAIIWFGSLRIDSGHMFVGDLMAFIQYAMQILFSLIMVSMMFVMIPRASASAVRINEVLDMDPDIKDPSDVQVQSSNTMRGYVEFRDVSFSYPGAEQSAISNISFSIVPGEVTAIIGGTGSGKSTLLNLILRFYDVNEGSILVDGMDVRTMSQEALRAKIGYVAQSSLLFTGTIYENIRYGKKDATDEEVQQAAHIAQATEFITEMKEGFNAFIAQGGTNVSGGQKQRLSIARALVRKPEIYLFDDSFSALDFRTDAKLRAALKQVTEQSTMLFVAQRVSTVIHADRIMVMDEGRIVGMGKHEELMDSSEVYREIVLSQLTAEEEESA